jgi:hypothetical protein
MIRHTGTLQQHPHVSADIGWTIIADSEPGASFALKLAFAATNDLKQARIVPAAARAVAHLAAERVLQRGLPRPGAGQRERPGSRARRPQ